jgi:hypothetical protein
MIEPQTETLESPEAMEHREAIERFFAMVDALPDDEYVRAFLAGPTMNPTLASPFHSRDQRSDAA